MSPSHHPLDDLLTAYAAGALEPGFGLVLGAHVEMCKACRAKVGAYEAISGDALDALPPAELSATAWTRMAERLDGHHALPPLKQPVRPLLERLPLKPKKWVAPGLWVAAVDTPHDPNDRVYLLGAAPGALTGRHSHSGAEFCTVLKGAFRDELGSFGAGDFAATDSEDEHQPIVEGREECICIFATEGRLKAKGAIARLAFRYADV
ncbi:MAG TPA: ChrR family anti-sigma-E factor [Caulobacterales bacterium]|nr:ChrR family anti-sigma-E factor [Caulobacterales bacterium]